MPEPKMPGDAARTRRRYANKGLSLRSVSLMVIVIVAVLAVGGTLLRRIEPQFELVARVVDTRVEKTDGMCTWFIDLDLNNTSERSMSIRGAELKGIDNSGFGILGTVDAGETIQRTYRYVLPDCDTEPATLGTNELIINFTLRLSTVDRSTTVDLG